MPDPLDDPTTLSLLFHLNSEPWLNDAAYEKRRRAARRRWAESAARGARLPPAGEPR